MAGAPIQFRQSGVGGKRTARPRGPAPRDLKPFGNLGAPNVVVDAAQRVRFERCEFTRLGIAGLDLQHGAQANEVVGCHFHDISASAIQISDVLTEDHHPADPRLTGDWAKNIRMHGNPGMLRQGARCAATRAAPPRRFHLLIFSVMVSPLYSSLPRSHLAI
jgi:hypothetical protein